MNGMFAFPDIAAAQDSRQRSLFRLALAASIVLHAGGLLTLPYWEQGSRLREHVITLDLTGLTDEETQKILRTPIGEPARETPRAIRSPSTGPPASPPPSRESIREKVASRGVLGMLSGRKGGAAPAGDPLSGIAVPSNIRLASRPAPGDFRPHGALDGGEPSLKGKGPGIGEQVAAAPRSSTSLASKIFRTDSGLEGEISGGIDDQNRSGGAIAETVRRYRSGIKYAYNKELLTNPTLSGKLVVSFVILPDGSVEAPEIRQGSMRWPSLEEAVLKRMRHWKFPKSSGAPVRVTFPFVFHPEM